jgi:hypothetical protein
LGLVDQRRVQAIIGFSRSVQGAGHHWV